MSKKDKLELLALLEEKERRANASKIDCSKLTRDQANDIYLSVLHEDNNEAYIRHLCRTDLFFLLSIACKRKDINKDWLYDRCREVELSPNGHLDLWAREHYKALEINTPIWTPVGWKRHGDLKLGDYVYSPSGKAVRVLANTGAMLNSDCYRVGEIIAGGDHLWPVQVKHRLRAENGRRVVYETLLKSTRTMGTARLPNINPLSGHKKKLSVDPYLLGFWLGDGHTGAARITSGHQDAGETERILKKTGVKIKRTNLKNSVVFSIGSGIRGKRTSSDFTSSLRKLGVYKSKAVPMTYMMADKSVRLALLQGLMDTDGHINPRGTATFVNTNKLLVDAVLHLARSMGMRAKKRRYENSKKGFWQVSFQAYKGNNCPFRLQRKKSRCKDGLPNMRQYKAIPTTTRPVNCIQVEGGLYLAGEELLPTHNSTIITFGKTIQDILIDPEDTFGIFSHTRGIAKGFLSQIKTELEINDFLKKNFSDILYQKPQVESPKWSLDNGIIVKRKSNPKESTVEAWGLVDGQPTSKHFKKLIYDDTVTRESVTTPEQIKKVTAGWELSLSLGSEGGAKRYIGTRYHSNDTYKTMIDRGSVIPRIYPATQNGKIDGEPVFMSKETLQEKRRDMGPYTFGTQMLQDPISDKSMGFKTEWLMYYEKLSDTSKWNKYILIDPASKKKTISDYTVMEVIGLSPDGNYYLLDAIRDRLNLTQRASKLFELHRKHKPKNVGYEQYGMQADIEHMKYMMEQENYRFSIAELGGQMPKEDRIKRLIPIFEQKRFYMPKSLHFVDYEGKAQDYVKTFIEDEYASFPVSTHDDMLDCRARILDMDAQFPKDKPLLNMQDSGTAYGWMGQ